MNIRRIITCGAAAFLVVASVGAAHAAFTAYNDCAMSSSGNLTNFQIQNSVASPVYTPTGILVDYVTGAPTGVTCTATASGALVMWTDPVVNVPYAAGTDAAGYFNGKLNFTGSPELNSASDYYRYTFSGLDPNKRYQFTTAMNRNGSNYTNRLGKYTIEGVLGYTNASSVGTVISDGGTSTTFCNGYNTVNGYVARWTDIVVASNGTFSVKAMQGTPGTKAYGFGMFMLEEIDPVVPEPGSVVVLASGLLSVVGMAIRRRSIG